MGCFSLEFWEATCILIVCIIAAFRFFKLIAPFLMQYLPPIVVAIIQIAIWLVIAIFCIKVIFGLLECLLGAGGGLFSSFPSHR